MRRNVGEKPTEGLIPEGKRRAQHSKHNRSHCNSRGFSGKAAYSSRKTSVLEGGVYTTCSRLNVFPHAAMRMYRHPKSPLLARSPISPLHLFPIHHIPKGGNVVGTTILVVQIIRMFPDIQP